MAADGRRHVLAIGGLSGWDEAGRGPGGAPLLLAYAASLCGRAEPRICVINTASADDPASYLRTFDVLKPLSSRLERLELFPMPNVRDPADLLLSQDMIFVGGGSVANMLAVWRAHGLDQVMRSAWQAGIVLSGVSAGAICWFAGGTTDSFGPDLRAFTDGLGFFAQSYCPHYDSEPRRRPVYQSLVAEAALADGIACDDGAAAHFIDEAFGGIITDRPSARGYLVERTEGGLASETVLPTSSPEVGQAPSPS